MNLLIAPARYLEAAEKQIATVCTNESFVSMASETFVAEFRGRLLRLLTGLRSYDRTAYFTDDLDRASAVPFWQGIVWWIGRKAWVLDAKGRCIDISLWTVLCGMARASVQPLWLPLLFLRVIHDLRFIGEKKQAAFPESLSVAYLRTDYWFGNKTGGSIAHTAGVANSFTQLGVPLFFLSSDRLELIDETQTPLVRVGPQHWMRDLPAAPLLAYNLSFIREGNRVIAERRPTLLYQRASVFNYSGAYLASQWDIPFVLEYNGPETWMAKNWGSPLLYASWADRIEIANLRAADAIIVVSQPLKDELIVRSIPAKKILVNPNGVDTERFDPVILCERSREIRRRLGVDGKVVIGFIATFERWHGAEVLAQAVKVVIDKCPNAHFLMIGDGVTMRAVRRTIEDTAMRAYVTLTGAVPQEEAPAYLAACDILTSPHVPNPDGTAFFGSPTKLFEYMAMARGIVASRLGQIGEILKDGTTAALVAPGSTAELAEGITLLVQNPELRNRLGQNAREEVAARYTWRAHTRRIIEHVRTTLEGSTA